jgi:hypothetical protein
MLVAGDDVEIAIDQRKWLRVSVHQALQEFAGHRHHAPRLQRAGNAGPTDVFL